jgi:hypothetical protein
LIIPPSVTDGAGTAVFSAEALLPPAATFSTGTSGSEKTVDDLDSVATLGFSRAGAGALAELVPNELAECPAVDDRLSGLLAAIFTADAPIAREGDPISSLPVSRTSVSASLSEATDAVTLGCIAGF